MEENRVDVDETFAKNLMQHALDLWINPEIERRRESRTLPDDFAVRRAQVIMNLDADAPEVRFNEEIKAVARARAARAIDAGEEVTEADLEGIEDIVLTDQDPNAGHLTMMLFKGHTGSSRSTFGTTLNVLLRSSRRPRRSSPEVILLVYSSGVTKRAKTVSIRARKLV